jgi:hypothetical protein
LRITCRRHSSLRRRSGHVHRLQMTIRRVNPYHVLDAVIRELAGALDHLHGCGCSSRRRRHCFRTVESLRAAIDSGAVAVWLLAPKSRDERIHRRLALPLRTHVTPPVRSHFTNSPRDDQPTTTTCGQYQPYLELRILIAEWPTSSRFRDPRTAHDLSASQYDLRTIVSDAGTGTVAVATCLRCSEIT